MTLDGLKKLGHPDPEGQAKREYLVYRELCMGKHLNPLLQQQHGFKRKERVLAAVVGPMTGEAVERAGWFALEHAVRLALMGAHRFLQHHVPTDRRGDLTQTLVALGKRLTELHDQAVARGWDVDPAPGRWRL